MKKSGKTIQINLSNRLLYTFIAIGILLIAGVGVYAYTGNVGHTADQIDEADPTVLDSVKDGIVWSEVGNIPAGFADGVDNEGAGGESPWRTSGNNIYYTSYNEAGDVVIGNSDGNYYAKLYVLGYQSTGTAIKGVGNKAVHGYGTNSGGYVFYADGAGTKYGQASSIRWKNNIVEIPDALDKVLNLRGVYFDWDEEHGGEHAMGMIAEEVGEYVSEIVNYEEDGIYATGMDYGALTPLLVEAIKEQQKQIDILKSEIIKLKQ